ncbi:tetratricopeptide repeat protein [Novipirellula herctigrandis]
MTGAAEMDIEQQLHRGKELERCGQKREAIDLYTSILAHRPDCAEAWQQRGTLRFTVGDQFDDALSDLEQFISLRPNDPDAYCDRGCLYRYVYFESEKEFLLELAIDDFTKAIDLGKADLAWCDDHLSDTYFTRGTCNLDLKRYECAINDFSQSLKEAPSSTAFESLARAYAGVRKYSDALQAVHQAIALSDDCPEAIALRAEIHGHLGNVSESERDLQRVENLGRTTWWSKWCCAIKNTFSR